ncbi:MAG: FKBP-type peptidyl-prolyl cis-trans isomerase [Candidatus Azobacteroides sp.]|nr:FKBP-type peptidyl-prolyl cis-trans isomerase [Candidatus Azobacteroides sp.]
MKISPYKFVAVSYKLYAGDNEEQDLVEETTADQPLTFISGTGFMLEAFEKNLTGLDQGEAFDFTLAPQEAYGEYHDDRVADLPKNMFEVEGIFDDSRVYEGAMVPMMDVEGNQLNGIVASIGDDTVVMDFNHPLAGDSLHFVGKVEEVREPSKEELEYAQNPHGGCGCGSEGCGDGCDSCN